MGVNEHGVYICTGTTLNDLIYRRNHRITGWFVLEATSKDHLVQPLAAMGKGILH